jgi:hypothetical protein
MEQKEPLEVLESVRVHDADRDSVRAEEMMADAYMRISAFDEMLRLWEIPERVLSPMNGIYAFLPKEKKQEERQKAREYLEKSLDLMASGKSRYGRNIERHAGICIMGALARLDESNSRRILRKFGKYIGGCVMREAREPLSGCLVDFVFDPFDPLNAY